MNILIHINIFVAFVSKLSSYLRLVLLLFEALTKSDKIYDTWSRLSNLRESSGKIKVRLEEIHRWNFDGIVNDTRMLAED